LSSTEDWLYDEGEDEKKQVRDQSEQFISADSFILIIIYKCF